MIKARPHQQQPRMPRPCPHCLAQFNTDRRRRDHVLGVPECLKGSAQRAYRIEAVILGPATKRSEAHLWRFHAKLKAAQ